jgi:uncharacterized Zn finger protein
MGWGNYGWRPYVSVGARRAKAARELAKLAKKSGKVACPVVLDGRKIASTFWGKAWCDNLEAYSDYANRLPRGRSYVRNGSVVDLRISKGNISAMVSGSELYRIEIKIKPLAPDLWTSIQTECSGKIDSLIELLQGKLSSGVMQIVTRREQGLFPTPKEIGLKCSCPDWADLCKHVAASLYGVGAMLDRNPELLFLLRGVDASDLISKASAAEAVRQTSAPPGGAPAMSEAEAADVFGIELEPKSGLEAPPVGQTKPTKSASAAAAKSKAPPNPKTRRRMSGPSIAKMAAAVKRRRASLKNQVPEKPRKRRTANSTG